MAEDTTIPVSAAKHQCTSGIVATRRNESVAVTVIIKGNGASTSAATTAKLQANWKTIVIAARLRSLPEAVTIDPGSPQVPAPDNNTNPGTMSGIA
mmetsp:Transcript_32684/g.92730  ORF Transcript_32684/g.92730 Transcript_32684/m.92730 type:complete len:96 (-) Transcript_32684:1144-1431(-)